MTNRLMYKQIVGDSGFKTADAFNESDHPRADNGQFGSGGGKAAAKSGEKSESKGKADKPASKESGKGAKPGWMLKADPALAAKVKANQARHQEMKKNLGSGPSKQGESKASSKPEPSFIQILNNPEAKRIVHQIEEMGNNPDLKAEKAGAIAELKQKYNFTWKE